MAANPKRGRTQTPGVPADLSPPETGPTPGLNVRLGADDRAKLEDLMRDTEETHGIRLNASEMLRTLIRQAHQRRATKAR